MKGLYIFLFAARGQLHLLRELDVPPQGLRLRRPRRRGRPRRRERARARDRRLRTALPRGQTQREVKGRQRSLHRDRGESRGRVPRLGDLLRAPRPHCHETWVVRKGKIIIIIELFTAFRIKMARFLDEWRRERNGRYFPIELSAF